MATIPWIRKRIGLCARPRVLLLGCVLLALLFTASGAQAARVSLLQFEGPRARQLKWRVSGALKRGGHTLFPMRAPSPNSPTSRFRGIAARNELDAFISAEINDEGDRWTLTMSLRGADGKKMKKALTFAGSSLSGLVVDIKDNAASRLDDALGGTPARGGDADARVAAADEEEPAPSRARNAGTGRTREVVDLDAPGGAVSAEEEEEAPRPRGKAKRRPRATEGESSVIDLDEDDSAADADPAATRRRLRAERNKARASSEETDSERSEDEPESNSTESEESLSSDASSDPAVDDGASDSATRAPSTLPFVRLTLGGGIVNRSLSYQDDLYDRLRTQQTTSSVLHLEAQLWVFARSVRDYFGIVGSFEGAVSGSVKDTDRGGSFGVKYTELIGGLRARYPLGVHEVGADVGFGTLVSALDNGDEANVPDYGYTFVRPALFTTLRFGDIWGRALLGVRVPTGYGELGEQEWFPRVGGYGIEGLLGAEYRISSKIGVELAGTLRRFVLSMNSSPADAEGGVSEVAGGAVDSYLSFYLGMNLSL